MTECTLVLSHSDEVSGTTIYSNGAKSYWGDGRSSEVVIIAADGTQTSISAGQMPDWMYEAESEGPTHSRAMTPAEEAEWEATRG
jgi:hypothetical protein